MHRINRFQTHFRALPLDQGGPVMIASGKEFAHSAGASSKDGARGARRSCFRLGLSAIVTLACCGVLVSVWRVAGDENRRQAIAAVNALDHAHSSSERVEAIRDLVRPVVIDCQVAIPPLVRSLADPAVEVRIEAARSLGPATSAAAQTDSDGEYVSVAIAALMSLLEDREPAARIAAVYALGSIAASRNPTGVIHPQTVVGALAAMLGDPDATVRASTIASLGVAGPVAAPEPPPALFAALDDESSFNRAAALRTLARFEQGVERLIPRLLGVLEREPDKSPVRGACVEVLRNIDPRHVTAAALTAVRAGLASRDRQVCFEAGSLQKRLGLDARPNSADLPEALKTEPGDTVTRK
jgi:HEAT repeat protein